MKEKKAMLKHTIRLRAYKTIHDKDLNLLPFTCTLLHLHVLSLRMRYIRLSILFSLYERKHSVNNGI